eukprot:PhM_4_TR16061/c0_g4_i1/m.42090
MGNNQPGGTEGPPQIDPTKLHIFTTSNNNNKQKKPDTPSTTAATVAQEPTYFPLSGEDNDNNNDNNFEHHVGVYHRTMLERMFPIPPDPALPRIIPLADHAWMSQALGGAQVAWACSPNPLTGEVDHFITIVLPIGGSDGLVPLTSSSSSTSAVPIDIIVDVSGSMSQPLENVGVPVVSRVMEAGPEGVADAAVRIILQKNNVLEEAAGVAALRRVFACGQNSVAEGLAAYRLRLSPSSEDKSPRQRRLIYISDDLSEMTSDDVRRELVGLIRDADTYTTFVCCSSDFEGDSSGVVTQSLPLGCVLYPMPARRCLEFEEVDSIAKALLAPVAVGVHIRLEEPPPRSTMEGDKNSNEIGEEEDEEEDKCAPSFRIIDSVVPFSHESGEVGTVVGVWCNVLKLEPTGRGVPPKRLHLVVRQHGIPGDPLTVPVDVDWDGIDEGDEQARRGVVLARLSEAQAMLSGMSSLRDVGIDVRVDLQSLAESVDLELSMLTTAAQGLSTAYNALRGVLGYAPNDELLAKCEAELPTATSTSPLVSQFLDDVGDGGVPLVAEIARRVLSTSTQYEDMVVAAQLTEAERHMLGVVSVHCQRAVYGYLVTSRRLREALRRHYSNRGPYVMTPMVFAAVQMCLKSVMNVHDTRVWAEFSSTHKTPMFFAAESHAKLNFLRLIDLKCSDANNNGNDTFEEMISHVVLQRQPDAGNGLPLRPKERHIDCVPAMARQARFLTSVYSASGWWWCTVTRTLQSHGACNPSCSFLSCRCSSDLLEREDEDEHDKNRKEAEDGEEEEEEEEEETVQSRYIQKFDI